MCGSKVNICSFQSDFYPIWEELEDMFINKKPKLLVLTSPNNPSGLVWSEDNLIRIINICKKYDSWLIVDQTYYELLFNDKKHNFPCSNKYNYSKIIHLFSFSKNFSMAGWRVGYVVFPFNKELIDNMRKIQDCIPAHTTILSQKLAIKCLDVDENYNNNINNNSWVQDTISSLNIARDALMPILIKYGAVITDGSFYFLVPVPNGIIEIDAIDILARKFRVLLMGGSAFGAPNYMRLSYGSINPSVILTAVQNIKDGLEYLTKLGKDNDIFH
jgi:aspartate/methionine/tyrosine aminotransferase